MTYITSEELRQRLAEQVPGALSFIARGLDVTVDELLEAVEAGRVTWLAVTVALHRGIVEREIHERRRDAILSGMDFGKGRDYAGYYLRGPT